MKERRMIRIIVSKAKITLGTCLEKNKKRQKKV